jgi:pimeloyl-ACP methyl ester carboxylesterase
MDVLSFRGKGRSLVPTRAESLRPTARNSSGRTGYAARLVVIVLALCLAMASCGGNAATSAANALQVKSCTVQGRPARCGTLAVPEDRLTGQGRQIEIKFVVIPASGPHRAPDPVVYLAGGPGDSAISEIPGQLPGVIGLNQDRDLVFIDQRGTGGSNGLTCPSPPNTLAYRSLVRSTIESCLASLRSQADLRFYTSAMAAQDVAQVLTALGYGQVNPYGVSYGVTAAQVFQRLFPGRVRTMTLISGTLLNIPIYEQIPQASQQALDGVFARCASDSACHRAFSHLAAEWAQLRASLAARPVTLPAAQSPTGTTIQLDNDGLASEVHQLLTGADTAVYVPLLIHILATAKNKTAALATVLRQIQMAGLPLGGFLSESVTSYPIRCAEPWARYQPGQIADPSSYYYQYIQADAQFWQYTCTLMPANGAAARYGPPNPSNVPVLMINGTADPQDPPANMSGAQNIWPNSRLLIEPGQSHEIDYGAWSQCDAGLIQAFVEHANAKQLNASCLTQVALPSFPTVW